ncbi:hypothetical protein D6T69_13615 [Tenacibaculum singaporense]|uniref:Uncharacterized protein n=1 Tax=Tenacibaculum singaporense TaxID=2358479 RepID=A0A3Q8RPN1_9FLAO|nr:hypothetical protein D6T69_13615 [Tenacibaculum singaporense]
MLDSIFAFFIRQPSLGKIKLALFPILIGGLSLDWFIKYDFERNQFEVSSGSDEILISILMIIVFVIIIFANLWDRHRERKINDKKIELLNNPNISEKIKMEILRQIS